MGPDNITQAQVDVIKAKLAENATVVIAGCNSGANEKSMQHFANKFNRPVIANTGDVKGLHGREEWKRVEPKF